MTKLIPFDLFQLVTVSQTTELGSKMAAWLEFQVNPQQKSDDLGVGRPPSRCSGLVLFLCNYYWLGAPCCTREREREREREIERESHWFKPLPFGNQLCIIYQWIIPRYSKTIAAFREVIFITQSSWNVLCTNWYPAIIKHCYEILKYIHINSCGIC